MLVSLIWVLGAGFLGGQLARRLGAPPLIGMIAAGIIVGPEVGDRLSSELLTVADDLRTIAVMVILMRAGLGLDRDKLVQQGSVAVRLGCLPALTEAIAVMVVAMALFQFDWLTGLLLGCIVGAESPAVIVPGMLRLKQLGWGVAKGIPDVILTGSALSDVLILLLFSLLVNILSQGTVDAAAIRLLPLQVVGQVGVGLVLGYLAARGLVWLLVRRRVTQSGVHHVIVVACVALGLVAIAQVYPYFSGYLAVMALGFFLVETDAPLARRLRLDFNQVWTVAEIVLFVLMGASIQLRVLETIFWQGLLLLAIGLLGGRMVGWWLSTLGSNWTWKEKLFLLPGNSAKATVQAAIGAIPLSLGIDGGEVILAIAALSILITAPLGAWAIQLCAPYLLQKDAVDPTKVAIQPRTVLLAAIDSQATANHVLAKTAHLARRCHADVVVLHQPDPSLAPSLDLSLGHRDLQRLSQRLLLDIRHQVIQGNGPLPEALHHTVTHHPITEIVMAQTTHQRWHLGMQTVALNGAIAKDIAISHIPVVLV